MAVQTGGHGTDTFQRLKMTFGTKLFPASHAADSFPSMITASARQAWRARA